MLPAVNTTTGVVYDRVSSSGPLSAIASRWIGRCKKCGKTHRLEGRLMIGARPGKSDYIVQASDGSVFMTADHGSNLSAVPIRCGDHWCKLLRVLEGTKKSKHECGARCTNATGPNCDCKCKGRNHGSNC